MGVATDPFLPPIFIPLSSLFYLRSRQITPCFDVVFIANILTVYTTEVCAVSRVSKKEIGKVFKKILKILDSNVASVSVEDFMSRFCANLNLGIAVQQLANEVARRALNLNLVSGRSPVSVAATAIYMAAMALGCRKDKKGESISAVPLLPLFSQ